MGKFVIVEAVCQSNFDQFCPGADLEHLTEKETRLRGRNENKFALKSY